MWPNNITGKRRCSKKWPLLVGTEKAGAVATGDSPYQVEIFLYHYQESGVGEKRVQEIRFHSKDREIWKNKLRGERWNLSGNFETSIGCQKSHTQGDSGGPSFVEESKNRYVVTGERFNKNNSYLFEGVVSGGRGTLGECGGINNPIHYVRVKRFTRWIVENIESEARWDTSLQL